jgi:hypothetical protein
MEDRPTHATAPPILRSTSIRSGFLMLILSTDAVTSNGGLVNWSSSSKQCCRTIVPILVTEKGREDYKSCFNAPDQIILELTKKITMDI